MSIHRHVSPYLTVVGVKRIQDIFSTLLFTLQEMCEMLVSSCCVVKLNTDLSVLMSVPRNRDHIGWSANASESDVEVWRSF